MIIRELILNDDELEGITAISLVSDPANEAGWFLLKKQEFGRKKNINKDLYDSNGNPIYWKYVIDIKGETDIIKTSRDFCKIRVNKIFTINDIKSWSSFGNDYKEKNGAITSQYQNGEFIGFDNFFSSFPISASGDYHCDRALFNCRHMLEPVTDSNELINMKKENFSQLAFNKFSKDFKKEKSYLFSNETFFNTDKNEILCCVLIPNQMIYRNDVDNGEDGYVFLNKETIFKLQQKFGLSNKTTLEHEFDINGLIMMESFIYNASSHTNYGYELIPDAWYVKYKVINSKVLELIKNGELTGVSIEALLSIKIPGSN